MEGVHLAKGGDILEYRATVNALSKLQHNHLSSLLALQGIQTFEHKRNEEKMTSIIFMRKSQRNSLLFIRNNSQDMEINLLNKFQRQTRN
jgi:hypothetical protein